MQNRFSFFLSIILLFVVVAYAPFLRLAKVPVMVRAESEVRKLVGWAWGGDRPTGSALTYNDDGAVGGIGWVSFSCESDPECSDDYGVEIGGDGHLSGFAWSRNFGWIQFGGLSGFPDGSSPSAGNARLVENGSDGYLTGWARLVARDEENWDGWISLRGPNYGVKKVGEQLQGFSWGGPDGLGWMDWSPQTGVIEVEDEDPCFGGVCIEDKSALDDSVCVANVDTVDVNEGPVTYTATPVEGGEETDPSEYAYEWSGDEVADEQTPENSYTLSSGFNLYSPHDKQVYVKISRETDEETIETTVECQKVAVEPFDYRLQAQKEVVSVVQGGRKEKNAIIVGSGEGPKKPVTLSFSGVPDGVTISYSASEAACAPNCSQPILISASTEAPQGEFLITVKGSPKGYDTNEEDRVVRQTDFKIKIYEQGDGTCTTPDRQIVAPSNDFYTYYTAVRQSGGCDSKTLRCDKNDGWVKEDGEKDDWGSTYKYLTCNPTLQEF